MGQGHHEVRSRGPRKESSIPAGHRRSPHNKSCASPQSPPYTTKPRHRPTRQHAQRARYQLLHLMSSLSTLIGSLNRSRAEALAQVYTSSRRALRPLPRPTPITPLPSTSRDLHTPRTCCILCRMFPPGGGGGGGPRPIAPPCGGNRGGAPMCCGGGGGCIAPPPPSPAPPPDSPLPLPIPLPGPMPPIPGGGGGPPPPILC